ncbi:hypothetical protein N657DRAFT_561878 [Parathielavia appendiculata]|uniref:Homeobox domain-containing protein n=1 Tax=Parathielavia appendiculata TaxID=2587402 RepID=A0AAN6UAW3_9PEZI|nr:hypothetical protein N657DRAFT_561878 [Parathielavia appendiculata]
MDMDYLDPFRRRFPGMAVQPFAVQQQGQPQNAQYPYWNPLMAYYQQQHRAAALMGQGSMQPSKPAEPKPRLAKDEVELLEREFAKNQKPSSSTKRELAEQMGVEVPRINNWFQNRRAKEKQMKKTAEFEAQQARERAASETKSTGDQDHNADSDYEPANQRQPWSSSTDAFGRDDDAVGSRDAVLIKSEPIDGATQSSSPVVPSCESPTSSDSDGFVHVDYGHFGRSTKEAAGLLASGPMMDGFGARQDEDGFQQPSTAFPFHLADGSAADDMTRPTLDAFAPHNGMGISDTGAFSPFTEHDYYATPSAPQFPSEMVAPNASINVNSQLLRHQESMESLSQSDIVSPLSMPDSPSTVSNLRFKSPPPPADIAGRRKSRRPAPLGLLSLRGGPGGPKTGIEVPRRADTVSPLRRISSATSLYSRVQKSFMASGGPRSPFAMDRNKEALLQSLQESQTPSIAPLNNAMPSLGPEGVIGAGLEDCAVGTSPSDDEQGFAFGSLGPVSGLPLYNADRTVTSPPSTPNFPIGFPDAHFPSSLDHAWNYAPQDEPLPTPSLCSHGGSEVEFSMAPHLPGYVASQPVTPSFPPAMGPAYTGFFGTSLGHAEYHFPDSYPVESSARSSPVAAPTSKQFQFAQNITPQDFNTNKS